MNHCRYIPIEVICVYLKRLNYIFHRTDFNTESMGNRVNLESKQEQDKSCFYDASKSQDDSWGKTQLDSYVFAVAEKFNTKFRHL